MTATTREPTDAELLAAYANAGDEAAFSTFVHRHVDWIYSAAARQTCSPKNPSAPAVAVLQRLIRLTGQVVDDSDRPVAFADVSVGSDGYRNGRFMPQKPILTDGTGHFSVDVWPEQYYLLVAILNHLVSNRIAQVIHHASPASVLLTLRPGHHVQGTVTEGPNHQAIPRAWTSLVIRNQSYYDLPKEDQLLPPSPSTHASPRKAIQPAFEQYAYADENGHFDFYTPSGEGYVSADFIRRSITKSF